MGHLRRLERGAEQQGCKIFFNPLGPPHARHVVVDVTLMNTKRHRKINMLRQAHYQMHETYSLF